ncbi:hyaluronidase-4-like [Mustela nigripes]|uniref:Hyaluronidase n=3 Tax=Mustela putorius furo TaxID=9669 RepID=A0A8U0MF04_MUSPF|nr:hyaluronidase-4 isoform X1 [Mustela putorius furo]XP_059027724.1 hyaluronidase-4-like isoform X1 [Mustela lutreola]XP_059253490.1 hyaluronidase-4-like [Mustela nigripes]
MCNPWMAWLGVLLPLIKFTHSVLKPALPPVIKNRPFNIFWAAPTMQCQHFFNVDLNLQLFNIISNPLETQRGSTIAIFYPNELGYYPYFSQDGKPFNGGIPQNMNLSKHLKKTADDIARVVSWWRSEGLVVIDWESWKPEWDRNWGHRLIYKNYSLAFTRNHHPDWSEMKVNTVAQQEFESAGRSFMHTTLTLALEMRPKCLWGFYLYPDCYNYDYKINPQTYTGKCPNDEIFRNDQLQWLWEKSTALYTSIYLDKILKSSLNALKFVHYRVREAMRIAEMARHDYILPVFIFSRPFYLHSIEELSQEDLVHTIGESAALGAAGIILWGGYEYSDSKETCLSVQKSIQGSLGHYAVNVTSAAKFCSQSLCHNNGRCIRKVPESSSYLHMPGSSTKKYILSKSFRFIISPTRKLKTIKAMKNGFMCHCYPGWHGESCQQHSSDLLRGNSKALMTNFNLSVFLSVTLSTILWDSLTSSFKVKFSLKY